MARLPGILGGTKVPEWPDFGVEKLPGHTGEQYIRGEFGGRAYRSPSAQTIWRASTDTKRPGTPVFSIWLTTSPHMEEAEARELLGQRLRAAYAAAHPNGCGSR